MDKTHNNNSNNFNTSKLSDHNLQKLRFLHGFPLPIKLIDIIDKRLNKLKD